MTEYIQANRRLWDAWTKIHEKSQFYDLEEFKAGCNTLKSIEIEELGIVDGKSLLHLQCHFGQDSFSWARLGAKVTGVDFSDEAIQLAQDLAKDLDIRARFICADIYDLPDVLDEQFDIEFAHVSGVVEKSVEAVDAPQRIDYKNMATILGRDDFNPKMLAEALQENGDRNIALTLLSYRQKSPHK